MSISQQIQALNTSRQNIAAAITQKGGTVSESDGFSQFATAITNLPSGGSGTPLIESIDVSDFSGTTFNSAMSYITGVTIPSGVTSIGLNALLGCSTLRNIVIPNTVTSIKASAFRDCTSLSSITIPNSVTSIENGAFQNCGITNVTIPYNVTSLGTGIFLDCRNLTSATLPDSLTTINASMFQNCTSLSSITIPNSVTSIENGAFFSCSRLNYIRIPSSVTNIGHNSLSGCTSLTYIMVSATTPPTLGSNTTLNNTNNCPIYVPSASVAAYKAASGWSTYASRIVGIEDAVRLTPTNGDPAISVKNYELATAGYVQSTDVPSTIKNGAGSLEVCEGVTRIGMASFRSGTSLTSVTLPSTLTRMDEVVFMDCTSLTSVTVNATTPPTLYAAAFDNTNNCPIYVPAASVDAYKAANNWSTYASRIEAIPSE